MILIASSSFDRLTLWEQGLQGSDVILTAHRLDSLSEGLLRVVPQLLLLDFDLPGLDGPKGIAGLKKANPATKIIVLTSVVSDELELALFKAGVRGCCRSDIRNYLNALSPPSGKESYGFGGPSRHFCWMRSVREYVMKRE